MRFKPLQDRIVVRKFEEDERRGIALPRGVRDERHACGEVVSVGPGSRFPDGTLLGVSVAVGDIVVFGKEAGEPLFVDSEPYVLLREGDIAGLLGAAPLVAVVKVVV